MLFLRTKFADKNTIWQQYFHLVSEVFELGRAILAAKFNGDWNHVADEAVDVQGSSDTLLHIAMEKHGADSHGAYTRVTIGNTIRGYYGRTSSE